MNKNYWKDWLYFSRAELRGFLILGVFIFVGISFWIWIEYKHQLVLCEQIQQYDNNYARFKKGIKSVKWNDNSAFEDFNNKAEKSNSENYYVQRENYEAGSWRKFKFFTFDPNIVDSLTFIRLGLMPYMVHNVLRYRIKGKIFHEAKEFAHIYDLAPAHYAQLLPYISIGKAFQKVKNDTLSKNISQLFQKQEKYTKCIQLDLNIVDTTDLKKIPGIGSGIARRIVNYRRQLGGFYTVDQLKEVKYLGNYSDMDANSDGSKSGKIDAILAWFRIGSKPKRVLLLNRFGIEHLAAHPYINFYQAKVIVEHRKKHGDFHTLDELSLYKEFCPRDLERLKYYVQF